MKNPESKGSYLDLVQWRKWSQQEDAKMRVTRTKQRVWKIEQSGKTHLIQDVDCVKPFSLGERREEEEKKG